MTEKDLQAREKVEVTGQAEGTRNVPVYVPAVDIYESADALTLVADMPGVSPENVTIDVKENGNTTVIIPVSVSNIPAIQAFGSLVQKGNLTVKVNGSAFVDIKVTEYELPFQQQRVFTTEDFEAFMPLSALGGTGINISGGLQQLGGLLGSLAGE